MSTACGLSVDTLRWYEKEGLLPPVERGPDGRRRYRPRDQDLVGLLVALRSTGMPTSLMREFVSLLPEGARSHGRRLAVLADVRELLEERARAVEAATAALAAKVRHYEDLIAAGLDCDGRPVPAADLERQRSTTRGTDEHEETP